MRNKWCDLDLFSLFDISCRIPLLFDGSHIRNIQIKTNYTGKIERLIQKKGRLGISILDYVQKYMLPDETVEIWNYRNERMVGRGKERHCEPAKWKRWKVLENGNIEEIK